MSARTSVDVPLRGHVPVRWEWDTTDRERPKLDLFVDDDLLFSATGRRRHLSDEEAAAVWEATSGADPIQVPGERWPAQISMELINLTDDVYLVRGVRTGFQHLVVETREGLIVADAPAGWVEFHHLPPSDLVPGLGVSGLSERFVDFLRQELPGRDIRANVLTHFHDDHAGGARAFAAAGAEIFASAASVGFLREAFANPPAQGDRLSERTSAPMQVTAVFDGVTLGAGDNRVRIMELGPGPHAYAMLGVWVMDRDYFFVSDIHVPRSDDDAPREGREQTECWFARWAVAHLPEDVRVVNSHSTPVTPVSRLARYLESDRCTGRR